MRQPATSPPLDSEGIKDWPPECRATEQTEFPRNSPGAPCSLLAPHCNVRPCDNVRGRDIVGFQMLRFRPDGVGAQRRPVSDGAGVSMAAGSSIPKFNRTRTDSYRWEGPILVAHWLRHGAALANDSDPERLMADLNMAAEGNQDPRSKSRIGSSEYGTTAALCGRRQVQHTPHLMCVAIRVSGSASSISAP
ncbi:hypothetical protein VTJ04DRAFT_3463 [Mycothermus thermophilus]|uniref:uncharacterized protein n=1 Tax=Humicola insolens TaxID=85995 RepID=UPI0037428D45